MQIQAADVNAQIALTSSSTGTAVMRRCFAKNLSSNILHSSQPNTCLGALFSRRSHSFLLKMDSVAGICFCAFSELF